MNFPVHRDNLVQRGKVVGKYLHIRHRVYGEEHVEIWKRFCHFWYIWQETRLIKPPKINRK